MPTYEYECECGHEMEKESSMSEMKKKVKCDKCGKMAPRAIRVPNAIVRHRLTEPARKGRGMGR